MNVIDDNVYVACGLFRIGDTVTTRVGDVECSGIVAGEYLCSTQPCHYCLTRGIGVTLQDYSRNGRREFIMGDVLTNACTGHTRSWRWRVIR